MRDCQNCALTRECCDQIIPLDPSEVRRLKALNPLVKIKYNGGRPFMNGGNSPCLFQHNRRCLIYDDRPSVCREWECSEKFVFMHAWAARDKVKIRYDATGQGRLVPLP